MAKRKKAKISIACDHAAYDLKKNLVNYLSENGYEVRDRGARSGKRDVDYPDYAYRVVSDILGKEADLGILVCGTGIGMCIAANRFQGIRAAQVHDLTTAAAAASHNHANIICLGGRLIAPHLARSLVQTWLDTPREARHKKRLAMIDDLACK